MGSCISKCRRKRKRQDQGTLHTIVQDKLVITQVPITPISLPQSPTTSSSVSSFSSTNGTTNTISSSSSCSISKERSFSNEFLKSCVKENPHIIHNAVKPSSTQNMRACANAKSSDFVLVRQKSFRRENEQLHSSSHSLSRIGLRSPSPTRRFSSTPKENLSNHSILDKPIVAKPSSSLAKRDNFQISPLCLRNNLAGNGPCLMKKERSTNRTESKIEELVKVREVLACEQDYEGGIIPMEEIANPLIALDCFIFL